MLDGCTGFSAQASGQEEAGRGVAGGRTQKELAIYGPDIPEELLGDGEGEAGVGDFCAGDFSEGDAPVHID